MKTFTSNRLAIGLAIFVWLVANAIIYSKPIAAQLGGDPGSGIEATTNGLKCTSHSSTFDTGTTAIDDPSCVKTGRYYTTISETDTYSTCDSGSIGDNCTSHPGTYTYKLMKISCCDAPCTKGSKEPQDAGGGTHSIAATCP